MNDGLRPQSLIFLGNDPQRFPSCLHNNKKRRRNNPPSACKDTLRSRRDSLEMPRLIVHKRIARIPNDVPVRATVPSREKIKQNRIFVIADLQFESASSDARFRDWLLRGLIGRRYQLTARLRAHLCQPSHVQATPSQGTVLFTDSQREECSSFVLRFPRTHKPL